MAVKFTNNASTTLAAGINTSTTTVTVASGQGALFPTLGASDHFFATLIDSSNNMEIVRVTARSTDTFTVVRAQDGTTARSFLTGDKIELRVTAAALAALQEGGLSIGATAPASPTQGDEWLDTLGGARFTRYGGTWVEF
jgi:hypothetical protein